MASIGDYGFSQLHEALTKALPDPLVRIVNGYRTKEIDITVAQSVAFIVQNSFQKAPHWEQFLQAYDKGESLQAALIAEHLSISDLGALASKRSDTLDFLLAQAKFGKKWRVHSDKKGNSKYMDTFEKCDEGNHLAGIVFRAIAPDTKPEYQTLFEQSRKHIIAAFLKIHPINSCRIES